MWQVRTYSKTFWKRYRELGEDQGEKYIKQIERGEQRIQRQQDIMDAIAAKMDRYRNPWQVSRASCLSPALFLCHACLSFAWFLFQRRVIIASVWVYVAPVSVLPY